METQELPLTRELFEEELNEILQIGLNLNVLEAGQSSGLRNLFYGPEDHIEEVLNPVTNSIDQRRQQRSIAILKDGDSYKKLLKIIETCKRNPDWQTYIETAQISRNNRTQYVKCAPIY